MAGDYRERLPLAIGEQLPLPAGVELNAGSHEDSDPYRFNRPFTIQAVADPKDSCQRVVVVGYPEIHPAYIHFPER